MIQISSACAGGGNAATGFDPIKVIRFGASLSSPSNKTYHGLGRIGPQASRATGKRSLLQATAETAACWNIYPTSVALRSGLAGTITAPIRAQANSRSK